MYDNMTSKQLKSIAKEKKVKNWWNLKKEEIIKELQKLETPVKQNKRGSLIEYDGRSQNICGWAKELGISANTLYHRLYYKKLSIKDAFELPVRGSEHKN